MNNIAPGFNPGIMNGTRTQGAITGMKRIGEVPCAPKPGAGRSEYQDLYYYFTRIAELYAA